MYDNNEHMPIKINKRKRKEMIIMPRRDGTGPMGMGPMTGRGAGLCNGDFANLNFERRFGGNGCQRGYRRQFFQTGVPGYFRNCYFQDTQTTDEKAFLELEEERLRNQLKSVKERLSNLSSTEE